MTQIKINFYKYYFSIFFSYIPNSENVLYDPGPGANLYNKNLKEIYINTKNKLTYVISVFSRKIFSFSV